LPTARETGHGFGLASVARAALCSGIIRPPFTFDERNEDPMTDRAPVFVRQHVREDEESEEPSTAAASRDGGARLLLAIARVRERFLDAFRALERRPEVRAARSGCDCRAARSGVTLELYLEADVAGRCVCWWLDATWRGAGWEISPSVLENRQDREGQEQLREFPVRVAAAADSLAEQMEAAAEELLATTEDAELLATAR
jgi:hypothetical protein